MSSQWEYKDFVYTWDEGRRPVRYVTSLIQTRSDIWNDYQGYILPEVRKWMDDGWEPITEIGLGGFEWRQYRKVEIKGISIVCLFFLFPIPLLFDILDPAKLEEVTAFRVQMRRAKR